MKSQVTTDKAADKKIAMIIAGLIPDGRLEIHFFAGKFQQFGTQLNPKKFVGFALIDQHRQVSTTSHD